MVSVVRRVVGGILLVLALLPVYRLLEGGRMTLPQAQAVTAGGDYFRALWQGMAWLAVIAVVTALASARSPAALERSRRVCEEAGRWLVRARSRWYAVGLAVLSAGITLAVHHLVLAGHPVLTDTNVQLIQARYMAAGGLAGPALARPEFWTVQFMVPAPDAWVSQYPPGHPALLAAGLRLGSAGWVAALSAAATVAFTTLAAERLLPRRVAPVRLAGVLLALSPFMHMLAAASLSHASAAAFGALALYCATRAVRGSGWWAIGAGAATGALGLIRPVSFFTVGLPVTLGTWWVSSPESRPDPRWIGLWLAGGLPFAAFLGWYNLHFFGSPFRLGYLAAAGPSHGIGFHTDPWGSFYGPVDALGYLGADLLGLGRELLASPLSAVAVVAFWLLAARRIEKPSLVFMGWALLPVLGAALYWHHDYVLGPRMLGEAAPAWVLLWVLSLSWLWSHAFRADAAGLAARAGWVAAALAVLVGLTVGASARYDALALRRAPAVVVQPPQADGAALVFVHEAWPDRVGARLAARGLRLDSLRSLMTRYSPCALQASLDGRAEPDLATCEREQRADRFGGLGLAGFLWQGDLPGLGRDGMMWVRDLGPAANRTLADAYPDREALMLVPADRGSGAAGQLVPLEVAMREFWDPAAVTPTP